MPGYIGYESEYDLGGFNYLAESDTSIVRNSLGFYLDSENVNSYPRSGSVWTDISGNNILNTLSNVSYESGYPRSFSFNGSSSSSTAAENSSLNSQFFSIEVVVNPASINQNGFWFEKGHVNTQYSLFMEGTNIVFRANLGSTTNLVVVPTSAHMSPNSWYHVVGTFISGSQSLFINGTQVGTGSISGVVSTNTNGTSIGVYGGLNGARGYWYNGKISMARIYSKALTAQEVLKNFNSLRKRYGI
jgi:hypothetical protein